MAKKTTKTTKTTKMTFRSQTTDALASAASTLRTVNAKDQLASTKIIDRVHKVADLLDKLSSQIVRGIERKAAADSRTAARIEKANNRKKVLAARIARIQKELESLS